MGVALNGASSPPRRRGVAFAVVIAGVSLLVYFACLHHAFGELSQRRIFALMIFQTLLLPLGFWMALESTRTPAQTLLPEGSMEPRLVRVLLPLSCVFLAGFIFLVGNHQFGAWDFNVIIDTGWRQISGQRPYVDFITPNPPGFNLGAFYAFRLFGVSWNAILLWTGLFSIVIFCWSYALCRALTMRPFAAWLTAFFLETITLIPTDFWWYNSATALLACVFLLSLFLCAQRRHYAPAPWMSYALALGLLVLLKPNIAGLLGVGGAVLLLVAAPAPRWKMLLWTAAGGALSLVVLWSHHVSVVAMLGAYRAAAIERGGLNAFALKGIGWPARRQLLITPALASLPVLAAAPAFCRAVRARDWRTAARYAMLFLPIPVALYGLATDAEIRENESAIIFAAAATSTFGLHLVRPRLTHLLFATQCALIVAMVVLGYQRDRVRGIGPKMFFEPSGNHTPIRDDFFTSLNATPRMLRVQDEVHRAARELSQPIFFGPRLEYEYADLRVPSPRGWTIYYQPGTSFARKDVARLDQMWDEEPFQTLIFLGNDRTFYSPEMLAEIDRDYRPISGFSELQVYVRRHP